MVANRKDFLQSTVLSHHRALNSGSLMGFEARQLGINSGPPPPGYGHWEKIDLALWIYSASHIPIVRGVGVQC